MARIQQIVCGILVVIMGSVACIEERGDLTNLGFGIPAGLSTVIAAGASIHTSRGFGGYRPPSGYETLSSLRFLGPTIQIAAPLTCLWLTAFSMNILLLVQAILTIKQPSSSETSLLLSAIEMTLTLVTLVTGLLIMRIDCVHDPD